MTLNQEIPAAELDNLTFVPNSNFFGATNRVIPQPVGVVGVIVPWNFPLNLSLVPLTAIFAAGNRAMVKMSENSRHLARLLIERLPAYFPPEKLQVFDETGGVGVEFSKLPFDHLLFTGSGATGRLVMSAAAQNLCPVTLELGGRSPAIVCSDFPVRTAAERVLFVKYLNAGQICTTVDHLWLPHDKIDAFVQAAREIVPARYPRLDSPDYTSIIDQRSFDRLLAALDDARERGATLLPLLPGPAFDAATLSAEAAEQGVVRGVSTWTRARPPASLIEEKMSNSLKRGQPYTTRPKTIVPNDGAVLPAIGSTSRWYI